MTSTLSIVMSWLPQRSTILLAHFQTTTIFSFNLESHITNLWRPQESTWCCVMQKYHQWVEESKEKKTLLIYGIDRFVDRTFTEPENSLNRLAITDARSFHIQISFKFIARRLSSSARHIFEETCRVCM